MVSLEVGVNVHLFFHEGKRQQRALLSTSEVLPREVRRVPRLARFGRWIIILPINSAKQRVTLVVHNLVDIHEARPLD